MTTAPGGKLPGAFFGFNVEMAMSRSPSSVRTNVRYYLWTAESAWCLPSRLHAELVSRRIALPAFANSRQRVVEAYVTQLGRRPLLVKARGVYYHFDARTGRDVERSRRKPASF